MIIPVLSVIAVLLLIWGIGTYNRLVTERLKVFTQWSQIDVVLKQRSDLVPNLVETIKAYASHETQTLQAVINARAGYLSAADMDARMKASSTLSNAMGSLMAVAESYPELKANQNFLHLQHQISSIEEKLADYRQFYNDTVLRYNSLLATVPTNLIASIFHFGEASFFQIDPSEKGSVTIEF